MVRRRVSVDQNNTTIKTIEVESKNMDNNILEIHVHT